MAPSAPPNVLLLLSDEHSFRALGHRAAPTGEPVATPTLDGLHARGTSFDQVYCQMPLCTPSRLSLLTGREVRGAGAWRNGSVLPPRATTIPDRLGRAGYRTALVGKGHLGGDRQFVGFDDRPYGDLTGGGSHQWEPLDTAADRGMRDRTREAGITAIPESHLQEYATMRESIAWIRDREATAETPWFLTASFSRPHFPLTAPRRYLDRYWDLEDDTARDRLTDPPVGREGDTAAHPFTQRVAEGFGTAAIDRTERQRARAAYFACVEFLDDVIGDFLGTLERDGTLENTVVIYASDHGELAGEHGLWWKHTWHEAATRVPLIVRTPGHCRNEHPPATIESPVGLVDLFPTICGLLEIDPPTDLDGADLSPAIQTGAPPERGPVVCDNLVPRWGEGSEFRAVRDGRFKYVAFRDLPEILVDLAADPFEQRNLATDPSALGSEERAALQRLREFVDRTMDFAAAERERADDAALRERHDLHARTESPSGNCYMRRDGTVIDADTALYAPTVVTAEPMETYSDYGGDDSAGERGSRPPSE